MKQHVRASFRQIHPSCELQHLPGLKIFSFLSFKLMFQLYIVIHAGAFKIYFAAVVTIGTPRLYTYSVVNTRGVQSGSCHGVRRCVASNQSEALPIFG